MPIKYTIESNKNFSTYVNLDALKIVVSIIILLIVVALIYLCIKYKLNGILISFAYIGYIASLLITLRYANVIISLESILILAILFIINYIFVKYILNKMLNKGNNKKDIIKKAYLRYTSILLPVLIISVIFSFIKFIAISSIGMVLFWGLVIMYIYNYLILNILLDDKQ